MLDGLRKEEVRKRIQGKGRALTERESKEILSLYGVSSTRERLAISAAEAVLFAEEIGYPPALLFEQQNHVFHQSGSGRHPETGQIPSPPHDIRFQQDPRLRAYPVQSVNGFNHLA